jgi:diguanylate cyclase (GGDEF)-like protein/putative nucleotidyltransferase with HDIG domain
LSAGGAEALAIERPEADEVPARARRARWFAWSGFVLVAATYLGAHLLPLPPRGVLVVNQLAFLVPIALAVVGGFLAYRMAETAERRFWLVVTINNALILAAETYYSGYMIFVDIKGPPSPSAFEALMLLAAALFFGLLMSMTRLASSSLVTRWRFVTDVVGCAIVAVAVVYAVVAAPLFDRSHITNPATRVLGALYPVIGIIMIGGMLSNVVGMKTSRWEPWEKLVTLGFGVFSVGLVLWPLAAVSTAPGSSASVFDLAYIGGEYLLLMATVVRLTTPGRSRLRPMPPPAAFTRSRAPFALVVPSALILGVAYFALKAAASSHEPLGYALFSVAAVTLVFLLITHTGLTAVENGHLFQRSVTDPLTGLYNHRHFHERLADELGFAARYEQPMAVAVLDLDDFSRVNNLRGHTAGDQLLIEVAGRIRGVCRDTDAVCRVGGDEFGLILPETSAEAAQAVCERVLESLKDGWRLLGWPVTASLGLALYPDDAVERGDLLRKADGAQYWAKYHGKDKAVRFDAEVIEALDADERIQRVEERSHVATVRALAAAVDARDSLTQDHSRNVARLAVALAAELGLDAEKVKLIEVAAMLHDIGKIGISDDVLKKKGPLSADERKHIQEHPQLGERILASTNIPEILPWALSHHERWDGTGYPHGLAGEDIPLEARILAICDAYDSMTSERPYRHAMTTSEALQELYLSAGTQFDPFLADAFIALAKRERPAI